MLSNISLQESCPCAHNQHSLILARHALSASRSSCFSPGDRTHNRYPSHSKLGGLQSREARKLSCPRWELDHISCVVQPIACHYADNILVLSFSNVLTKYDEYFVPKTNDTFRTDLSHTLSISWRV
jgi:hypothetical protein